MEYVITVTSLCQAQQGPTHLLWADASARTPAGSEEKKEEEEEVEGTRRSSLL